MFPSNTQYDGESKLRLQVNSEIKTGKNPNMYTALIDTHAQLTITNSIHVTHTLTYVRMFLLSNGTSPESQESVPTNMMKFICYV